MYQGGYITLLARDHVKFEMQTVNETAYEPPPDYQDQVEPGNPNSQDQLMQEATAINEDFAQQVLAPRSRKLKVAEDSEEKLPELRENPFVGEDSDEEDEEQKQSEPARLAYRYRRWTVRGVFAACAMLALPHPHVSSTSLSDSFPISPFWLRSVPSLHLTFSWALISVWLAAVP